MFFWRYTTTEKKNKSNSVKTAVNEHQYCHHQHQHQNNRRIIRVPNSNTLVRINTLSVFILRHCHSLGLAHISFFSTSYFLPSLFLHWLIINHKFWPLWICARSQNQNIEVLNNILMDLNNDEMAKNYIKQFNIQL